MLRRQLLGSGPLLAGTLAAGSLAVMSGHGRAAQAAELTGIDGWINTEPISMPQLRGTVGLVNFWTYSCINSRRPMMYLKRWHAEYGPLGLRVIGIHTPEFRFEHDRSNVETYIRQEGILFSVGLDNKYETWNVFRNEAWPGFYLVNREGHVVLRREGEGYAYDIERAIRDALALARSELVRHPGDDPDLSRIGSPETYFGAQHPTPQNIGQSPRLGTAEYSFSQASGPALNEYLLDGTWSRQDERLVLASGRGGLRFRFSAAKLHMVAGAPRTAAVRIRVDGHEMPPTEIGWPTLYTLVDGNTYGEHLLELEADTPGLTLFSATFG
ncbi:MAG: redoxin domain-containing protein [Acetobacteraceae bacterium]|nr:redoxin domain-containing protein [Acetobacteraceae bacterium]